MQIEDSEISLSCGICYEDYDSKVKKPHVMKCGHSLCYKCLKSIISNPRDNDKTCPFDKKQLSRNIDDYPVNWAYLDMISLFQQKSQKKEVKSNSITMTFSNGIYEGELVRSNIREGEGKMKYKSGLVYEGQWKNDQRKGKGKLTYQNGDVYEGNWDNDLENGQGILTYKSNNIKSYNGNWKDGKFFGLGIKTYENDIGIEGIYCNNSQLDSEFFKQITKDSIVIGKYQNINYNNQNKLIEGYEININGFVAKGFFEQNIRSYISRKGNFTLTYNNGDAYLLHYASGICSIYGEIKYSNGDIYKGDLKLMKKDGNGVMNYKSLGSYKGQFKNDAAEGNGKLTYEDGGCYEGEWLKGFRHGIGNYSKKQYSYDGQWAYNEKNGVGVETMENGESYSGSFNNNVKEGQGLYIYKNFDTYKGQWKDNEQHGQGTFVSNDGSEVFGTWNKGKLVTGTDKNGKKCIIF